MASDSPCRAFWEHVRQYSAHSIVHYNQTNSALPILYSKSSGDLHNIDNGSPSKDLTKSEVQDRQGGGSIKIGEENDTGAHRHDAFVALYVIEGDPQWDFARAAGGLIMHTRPDVPEPDQTYRAPGDDNEADNIGKPSPLKLVPSIPNAPPPLPRLVILRGVNELNNCVNAQKSDSWGGDSQTRFSRSCNIPNIVARPAVHLSSVDTTLSSSAALSPRSPSFSSSVPSSSATSTKGSYYSSWSVFRTDRISKYEKVGSTDVNTALAVIRRRRFKLRKLDVRMCRAALRRRCRIQYQTLSPAWARCSELFRLADAVWSFNENVSADRSSGGSSNVHYAVDTIDGALRRESLIGSGSNNGTSASSTGTHGDGIGLSKKMKKEISYVAPLLEISVIRSVAAVTIQSLWRGYCVRKVAKQSIAVRVVLNRAATVMQRWWRVRLFRRRCIMLAQLKALLVNTRNERFLCLSEESARRLTTFQKLIGVTVESPNGMLRRLTGGTGRTPMPESKIRYCIHMGMRRVFAVMSQNDIMYKRVSAISAWTGVSLDLIPEGDVHSNSGDYSPIYSRTDVTPLIQTCTAACFDSDDEDDRGRGQTTSNRDGETSSVATRSATQSSYSFLHGSNTPQLIKFRDSHEARRRTALLFLLTWDVHTMRGVEMVVHPDLHSYRITKARRYSSLSVRSTPDRDYIDDDENKDNRIDKLDAPDHGVERLARTSTVAFHSEDKERRTTFKSPISIDPVGRGSGINGWREGWMTAESAGVMAEFESSMYDFVGLNRNISPVRPHHHQISTREELSRERKQQAIHLKQDLERMRQARLEFDVREEHNRKIVINKVLTPSIIVRSPNTSSATFKHYMNDSPMLQMRAKQLSKAELIRKKVLVESMQAYSKNRKVVRDNVQAATRMEARSHVMAMRNVYSDSIAHKRKEEDLENSRRVAFRDWERQQTQERLINVKQAKQLSAKLSSMSISMQRQSSHRRKELLHLATSASTRSQSMAERDSIRTRRTMMTRLQHRKHDDNFHNNRVEIDMDSNSVARSQSGSGARTSFAASRESTGTGVRISTWQ